MDMFKINFDASISSSHEAGFGLIARDKDGEILVAATSTLGHIFFPFLAKALCVRWVVGFTFELDFQCVCLETNCFVLFDYGRCGDGGLLI